MQKRKLESIRLEGSDLGLMELRFGYVLQERSLVVIANRYLIYYLLLLIFQKKCTSGSNFLAYFCDKTVRMLKWLYKIVFLITGIFFALAILEIHGENSQNTFFDQDDTFIKTENQNCIISSCIEKQKELTQELNNFTGIIFSIFSPDILTDLSSFPRKDFTYFTPKIFLRNSVWRI
jgi:hypothetical protein